MLTIKLQIDFIRSLFHIALLSYYYYYYYYYYSHHTILSEEKFLRKWPISESLKVYNNNNQM